jgi:hypothetical protein
MSGPDTKHKDYDAHLKTWKKCRDVVAGEDAVHEAQTEYLPMLSEQTPQEYRAYVKRTPFYNATARTIDGLVGMVLRKEPTVEAPAALDAIRADMTLTGCALPELAENILREVLPVARYGVLVEYPLQIEGPLTQAQASALNRRPYASVFKAEHIINWRVERINNAMQPVMIVLSETVVEWVSAFESQEIPQRRALLLEGGKYLQRVYRKGEKDEWEQWGPDIVPLMSNNPLDYIPFVIFGPSSNSFDCQKPPIYDLACLNLSHYRTIADYEHGAHFTGLPMLFLAGVQLGEGEKVPLGSTNAVTSPDPQADGKFIEFTGQGLGALKDRAAEKEAGMAAIGARMLAPEKAGVEAEGALKLRHSGESAVLTTIAKMVGAGLTRVLRIMADWEGIDAEVSVEMNTDFIEMVMTPQEIDALVKAWQTGAISRQTLHENLQAGEIVAPDVTAEEEEARIGDAPPTVSGEMSLQEKSSEIRMREREEGGDEIEPGEPQQAAQQAPDFAPVASAIESLAAEVKAAVQPMDVSAIAQAIASSIAAELAKVLQGIQPQANTAQAAQPPINVTVGATDEQQAARDEQFAELMSKLTAPKTKRLSITAPSGAVYEGEIKEET